MDPKIIKKTQDTLGTLIKKPPLTEKLLGKPPFRFLHDVMTSVIKTTGFMQGLYSESEMNSENVKDKDAKVAFLQKSIDMVCAVTGKSLSVKPIKIVAGHEPEKTNEFLQALAAAISKGVNNDEYVQQVLKGSGGGGGGGNTTKEEKRESHKERDKEKEKDRDRTKSADRRKARDSEERPDKDRHKERSRDKEEKERSKDRGEKDREHDKDKDRDRERRHEKDRDRHKDRDSKTRDKSRDGREDRHKEKSKRSDHREKENESPDREKMNGEKGEKQEAPSRLQRPSSAKGSRRRREAQNHTATEDEEFQKPMAPSSDAVLGEGDLPPQVAAARQLGRPSSARPAPPRPKQDILESEPAMRLGAGQPTNVIVDNDNDEDEDENFLVEETAPPPPEPDMTPAKPAEEEDAQHGALVEKMLKSKRDLDEGNQNQTKKTEIERPVMSDAQRRKQRELVQKEVDKLRSSIQSLTRSANPLGKVMDYVQEDLDAIQQELDKWRTENAQHALDLKREMNVTDRAIEPLRQQLAELDRAIKDQLGQIAATKSNIIKNDQKMQKMLHGISGS